MDRKEKKQGENSDYKILIVEDNMINQLLLKTILENEKFYVEVADDGLIGLEKVKKIDFDLILMDLMMPNMDGLEATKTIRELVGEKSKIPIIAVTADVTIDVQQRCKDVGMNYYLSKPINRDDLLNSIATLIN